MLLCLKALVVDGITKDQKSLRCPPLSWKKVWMCLFCQQIKATVSIFKNLLLQPEAQRVLSAPAVSYAAVVTSKAFWVVLCSTL